ncbi:MAG TPA: antibiotic biosynthesis monooxygenase family protein [Solirubrobacteraceae bacterium]|nr:antibiotic biosynthesis monooxygenase family protein [Solirubrobacteraceae bacterium]
MTTTLINAFEVPPEDDEPFIAGWERARDFLAAREAFDTTVLHRALRPDAELRFVNVARVRSPPAWREAVADPAFPGGELPYPSHPALYDVVHEDGGPDGEDGIVLINPFEVPAGDDERFVAAWHRARDTLADAPGYLGTRLYRSAGPADFRVVNVARWSSPLAFSRAVQRPEFQAAAEAVATPAHPALYQIVRR